MTAPTIICTRCSQPITGAECANCGFIGERTGWPPKPPVVGLLIIALLAGWAIARYCCE